MGGTETSKQETHDSPTTDRPPNQENQPRTDQAPAGSGRGESELTRLNTHETDVGIEKTKPIERWQLGINATLAVVGRSALFVYYSQLSSMNKTLYEIQKQTPEIQRQADAAQEQLDRAKADSAASELSTQQQLSLMRQQITQQENTTRLDKRAWVAVSPRVTGPLYFDRSGAWLPIEVEMQNVGRSPAKYVKLWEKLVVTFAPPTSKEIETTCALLKKPPTSKETNGWALFPNQVGHQQYPGFAPRSDLDSALAKGGIPGKVGSSLILCADYTMTFDPQTHHQTRQAYAVEWFDRAGGGRANGAFDPQSTPEIQVALDLRVGGYTD